MTPTATLALTASLIVFGAATVLWLMVRSEKKARLRASTASEDFRRRLESPDLDGLERQLGQVLPASFRALYQDRNLILSDSLLIGVANPLEADAECYVAWFQPADPESLRTVWPGCEGLFPIADNGAGDQFLVDLRHPDPEVIYHLHETGERRGIGVPLSAFLAAPRRPAADE